MVTQSQEFQVPRSFKKIEEDAIEHALAVAGRKPSR